MELPEYERKKLEEFFEAVRPNLAGYKHGSFSYFAVKNGDKFELSQGRLLLQSFPCNVHLDPFKSANTRAAIYRLDELNLTPRSVIESLLSGALSTPQGELHFPPEQSGSHSLFFVPFGPFEPGGGRQPDADRIGPRHIQLYIRGGRRCSLHSDAKLDWELEAASKPFASIQDLCNEYGVGKISGMEMSVEVVALNVASIAADSSIRGTKASLAILLANGLEREQASLGYNIFEKDKVIKRGHVLGSEMQWTTTGPDQRGELTLEVPVGAVLHCSANYAGEVQDRSQVIDPSVIQNPFRVAHQTFDHELEILSHLINKPYVGGKTRKDRDARNLEIGVAWLFWMLGFRVTHLDGLPEINNAPDLIAATPGGDIAVIEYTTGLLKAENKLPLLVERTEKVRQSLAASGHANLSVLPIIVTTKTRGEVMAELDQARNAGVYVIAREELNDLIERSSVIPDADGFYERAESTFERVQIPPFFGLQ
jgi:hypothetical protein